MPSAILKVRIIIKIVSIAGKYSVKSVKSISFRLLAINKDPTIINKAEITANEISEINGIKAIVKRK